jgi:transposase-like protein
MKSRRKFTGAFKAKVALEAIREHGPLCALNSRYEPGAGQISKWKHEFLEKPELVFSLEPPDGKAEKEIRELKQIIGDLHVRNEFLKKTCRKLFNGETPVNGRQTGQAVKYCSAVRIVEYQPFRYLPCSSRREYA